MTISYPLSIPTYPNASGVERLAWTNFNAVALLRSPYTFQTQVQEHSGQLWAADVDIAVSTDRRKIEPWIVFLSSLMGPKGTFLMGDPSAKTPMGSAAGSPQVNLAGQTGNTLNTKGWTASQANVLIAGDYIQIGNRLYKVLANASSNGSGLATLDIWPRLRESPPNNTPIVTSNAKGLFRIADSEVRTQEVDRERVYSVSFSMVEAI